VLTQCIRPGAPVIYGSVSASADIKNLTLTIGNAESALIVSAGAQMGRFYDLPTRGGGGLSDSKIADGQAGYESMMLQMAAAATGINYVLHTAGILENYAAFSYEKFVMDDEIAGLARRYAKGIDFSEEMFVIDDIREAAGIGHFLFQEDTPKLHRREFRMPQLSNRETYAEWSINKKDIADVAWEKCESILAEYEIPPMDEQMKSEIERYIETRVV